MMLQEVSHWELTVFTQCYDLYEDNISHHYEISDIRELTSQLENKDLTWVMILEIDGRVVTFQKAHIHKISMKPLRMGDND